MIYNLQKFIQDQTGITVRTFGWGTQSSYEGQILKLSGGETQNRDIRTDTRVQVVWRGQDADETYQRAETLHNFLKNRYGEEMPEVIIKGKTYPAITAWRINPIQDPGWIGVDVNGMQMFSANYIITTQEP